MCDDKKAKNTRIGEQTMRVNSAVDILAGAGVTVAQAAENLKKGTKVTGQGAKDTMHNQVKRTKLPENRWGITRKARACGMKYYVTVNFYPDTVVPAEVFCRIAKEGSVIAGFIEALMITISIALQYSVPWDVLYDKYLHQIFEPRDDKNSSLVDAMGKTISEVIKIKENESGTKDKMRELPQHIGD